MVRGARRHIQKPKGDGGTYWMSYSDLMAGVMILFVLILFYVVYQYSYVQETKTRELLIQAGVLDQKQQELADSQTKLSDTEKALISEQAALLLKDKDLKDAQELLERQRAALEAANIELAANQTQLATQRTHMAEQQLRIDALIGVRGSIINTLHETLRENNLTAAVDPRSGAITFSSGVFFDTGQFTIKPEGEEFLDKLMPLYLNVLLSPENRDYISEIIIEGHTDSDGSFMSNLALSQNRALAVATYIVGDSYTSITQEVKNQLRAIITANGRSYSYLVADQAGNENKDASRRVEFKFRLKDEEMLQEMNDLLKFDD